MTESFVDILLALKDKDSYCVRNPMVLIASASSWLADGL